MEPARPRSEVRRRRLRDYALGVLFVALLLGTLLFAFIHDAIQRDRDEAVPMEYYRPDHQFVPPPATPAPAGLNPISISDRPVEDVPPWSAPTPLPGLTDYAGR